MMLTNAVTDFSFAAPLSRCSLIVPSTSLLFRCIHDFVAPAFENFVEVIACDETFACPAPGQRPATDQSSQDARPGGRAVSRQLTGEKHRTPRRKPAGRFPWGHCIFRFSPTDCAYAIVASCRVFIIKTTVPDDERDSEASTAQLVAKGYSLAASEHVADVVLLNTCSVRDNAEQKGDQPRGEHAGDIRKNRPKSRARFSRLHGAESG